MRALHVIILAAGGGTRMKSDFPKVLHPICGRPMIAYALDLAAASGVKQPIVVLGESVDAIKPHLPKEVKVVLQPKPLGTGHAVLSAKKALDGVSGDVLILYADTPLLRRTTIQRLIETHTRTNAVCTLLTTHLADPTGYGRIVRDAVGEIVGVVEEAEATAVQRAVREINVGPICLKMQPLFEALASLQSGQVKKEWYLTQAIGVLAKQPGAKFQAIRLEAASEGAGVNSQMELAKATAVIRQRILEAHLNNGVTIVDPATTYIDHGVTIGHDTVIHPGSVIESGVAIGRRCSIGPFAHLRRGTAVADEARLGNFVELVRTKVGLRVRMQHVSYLGDTVVEDDVNIGAGTITANYDGTNKFSTVIGKGAFIGCDTVLVAPVKVGPGAVTGAGSVIPKGQDVPPRGIVVGVPARPLAKSSKAILPSSVPATSPPSVKPRRVATPLRTPSVKSSVKKARTKPSKAAKKPPIKRAPVKRARHPAVKRKPSTRRPVNAKKKGGRR